MNNWHAEFMAEYDRQRILQQVAQVHLEKFELKSCIDRPRLLERMMFNVANWLISAGEQLRKQDEISQEERWNNPRTRATL